ncbi:hypothetical protein E2C01_050695 [Portunus trituberculatus]|uniref:THAP-type domain-containing protein n=1 Tax=Portunus trituberculatus TaxID=210409 RepID=A0A5B7GGU0_PORTR|nr:hypothetical protein [Portunus trituberculatus]
MPVSLSELSKNHIRAGKPIRQSTYVVKRFRSLQRIPATSRGVTCSVLVAVTGLSVPWRSVVRGDGIPTGTATTMVHICCVKGCRSSERRKRSALYHRFPRNIAAQKLWKRSREKQ